MLEATVPCWRRSCTKDCFRAAWGNTFLLGSKVPIRSTTAAKVGGIGAVSVFTSAPQKMFSPVDLDRGTTPQGATSARVRSDLALRFSNPSIQDDDVEARKGLRDGKTQDCEQARPYYQHTETGVKVSLGPEGSWYDLRCMEGEIRREQEKLCRSMTPRQACVHPFSLVCGDQNPQDDSLFTGTLGTRSLLLRNIVSLPLQTPQTHPEEHGSVGEAAVTPPIFRFTGVLVCIYHEVSWKLARPRRIVVPEVFSTMIRCRKLVMAAYHYGE